jgi:hypothetical protein
LKYATAAENRICPNMPGRTTNKWQSTLLKQTLRETAKARQLKTMPPSPLAESAFISGLNFFLPSSFKTLAKKVCAPANLCYNPIAVGGQFFDIAALEISKARTPGITACDASPAAKTIKMLFLKKHSSAPAQAQYSGWGWLIIASAAEDNRANVNKWFIHSHLRK